MGTALHRQARQFPQRQQQRPLRAAQLHRLQRKPDSPLIATRGTLHSLEMAVMTLPRPMALPWTNSTSGTLPSGVSRQRRRTLTQDKVLTLLIADCANLWPEEAYCIGISDATSSSTILSTTSSATSTSAATTTSVTPPAATQTGIISTCNKYAIPTCKLSCLNP